MKIRAAIFTLGCRVNNFESLALADAARSAGFVIVDWRGHADVGIVNSCAITALAETKTRRAINDFMRINPHACVAVTGCFAETDAERVAKIRGVRWVAANSKKAELIKILADDLEKNPPKEFDDSINLPPPCLFKAQEKTFADSAKRDPSGCPPVSIDGFIDGRTNIKIQDGCDNFCSYCIIPRARGLPRSRPFNDIMTDARNLVLRGARELVVTGINISKYNAPRGGLVDILDALNSIDGLLRIRIGSLEPPDLPLEALAERMKDHSHKLCPNLHLSPQSLNDNVLKAMRRKYCAADFLKFTERAKTLCPDIAVGADIICGHPYEGDAEFADTQKKALESGLSYLHVFTFSPRPLTAAARMPFPPKEIRAARAAELRKTAEQMRAKFFRSQLGKTRTVLIENDLPDGHTMAYTDNYIHCIFTPPAVGLKNRLAEVEIGLPDDLTATQARVHAKLLRLL